MYLRNCNLGVKSIVKKIVRSLLNELNSFKFIKYFNLISVTDNIFNLGNFVTKKS